MAMQEICRVDRLPPHLRVKVEAALGQAARLEDMVEGEGGFGHVVGELVGVPARLQIVAVGVDRTEDSQRRGQSDFVLEGVVGEESVTHFDVALDPVFQAIALEEAINRGDVKIILVLGRLLRLGLEQDLPLEADLVGVLDHQMDKAGHLVELRPNLGIEQCLIALTAAPEHIVGAAQFMGQLEHVFDLASGIGEYIRVRVGGGPGHIAAVGEEICRAPKQPGARRFHLTGENLADLAHIAIAFGQRRAFGGDIGIMEAEERNIEQVEKFKRYIRLEARPFHALVVPWPVERAAAKRVAALPRKGVPVGNGRTDMILHALAGNDLVLVVVSICQRVGAVWAFEFYGCNTLEKVSHIRASSMAG